MVRALLVAVGHLAGPARRVTEGEIGLSRYSGLPIAAGEYVSLTIRDDGCGIRAANLPRIF